MASLAWNWSATVATLRVEGLREPQVCPDVFQLGGMPTDGHPKLDLVIDRGLQDRVELVAAVVYAPCDAPLHVLQDSAKLLEIHGYDNTLSARAPLPQFFVGPHFYLGLERKRLDEPLRQRDPLCLRQSVPDRAHQGHNDRHRLVDAHGCPPHSAHCRMAPR